jgi:hypothetical protein
MSKPIPWSYSSLSKFSTCPHQFYETRVLGNFQDEPGEAALWGTYVHKQIENAVEHGTAMPENTKKYAPQVWAAIGGNLKQVHAEVKLAIDTKFNPVEWSSGRWCGSISDILKEEDDVAYVIDWKLGKIKITHQLKLNVLMVFHNKPHINTVHTSFEWLQFGQRTREVFTRDQVPQLWDVFMNDLKQYAQAFRTDTWQKRPSGLCQGWCPVTTCPNWRPKR